MKVKHYLLQFHESDYFSYFTITGFIPVDCNCLLKLRLVRLCFMGWLCRITDLLSGPIGQPSSVEAWFSRMSLRGSYFQNSKS